MKQYYRAVANLRELNDALLQHLDEAIVQAGTRAKIIPLNKRFQINNGYIEVTDPRIFERFPFALLEILSSWRKILRSKASEPQRFGCCARTAGSLMMISAMICAI